MKNKVLLICGSLLLLLFIVLGTYTWYLFFLRTTGEYSIVTGEGTRSGDIALIDNGNNAYETDASDVSDEDVNNVLPYKFKIINQGNDLQEYTLYLEDLPVNSINDGCTNQTLLKREQLKYQLIVNSKVIKEDYLSNIKDNILDTRSVNGKDANAYELRIYIHDEAEDWYGKHYHYRVVLKKTN